MNHGPLIFLAAFFALASSWIGFVLTPQMQVGQLQQTNAVASSAVYPVGRPGLAREGLEVYRANGCATCHSQNVGQMGTVCDVLLNQAGTNQAALLSALAKVDTGLSGPAASNVLKSLPQTILRGVSKPTADAAVKLLNGAGAKAQVWVVPTGPDLARGWGRRRTVARDYVFDYPVMLGSQRIGPDLANIGVRQPDPNWHLRHLYAPQGEVKGSTMPPYRFLFQTQKIGLHHSEQALPGALAPGPGLEVVPRPEARALVAYLLSLKTDVALFEAPFSVAALPAEQSGTNAATASSANGASTNNPAK
jgi:cbb3-type cytochrome oxidase cytochrome c subunit